MIHVLAVLAPIAALTFGAIHAAAETPAPADDIQIDGIFDKISNHDLIEAIIAAAPTTDLDDSVVEPAVAAVGSDWMEAVQSIAGYPVTKTISLGVAYHLEEIEELTADFIEMGTVGVDYTSHNVLVRANWSFDFEPNLF